MTATEIINKHEELHPQSSYFSPRVMVMFGDKIENFTVLGPGKAIPITPTKIVQNVYGLKRIKPVVPRGQHESMTTLLPVVWLNADTFVIVTNVEKIES